MVSGFTQADLDKLWSVVEAKVPVQRAAITTVLEPLPSFTTGPEPPPFRPEFIQYSTQNLTLPKGFKYGVASAAQQVEGAVKDGGRGPTHWDYGCHNILAWCNNFTSDITVNTYYQYKQDIQRLKAMEVNTLSFSISWARIFPFATADSPVNQEGVDFYNNFINELIKNGIEPVATLFHWDTPINIMLKYGGFFNESVVADYNHYAKTVFSLFGDRVKQWVTFNEPNVYCSQYTGYPFVGYWPQGINASNAIFPCARNLLLAHGNAVQTYRSLKGKNGILDGEIGMKFDSFKPIPFDPSSEEDVESTNRFVDFHIGLYAQPIYVNGTFPNNVRNTIPKSIMPDFSPDEVKLIAKSGDFFAIDAYATGVSKAAPGGIEACAKNVTDPFWPVCVDGSNNTVQWSTSDGWGVGASADFLSPWLQDAFRYLRLQLKFMSENYPAPGGLYLSEFGFVEPFEEIRPDLYNIRWDQRRTDYLLDYLNEVLLAIHVDKVPLKGTFIWSYVDNFEWNSGLEQKFGLQFVNHSTPGLDRHYKMSFFQVRDFFRQHLQSD